MNQNRTAAVFTEHKTGKITYLVCAFASENAADTLDQKIKKLIAKEIRKEIQKENGKGI